MFEHSFRIKHTDFLQGFQYLAKFFLWVGFLSDDQDLTVKTGMEKEEKIS